MIVRILGEGQWRLDDADVDGLNSLDERVEQAVDADDEEAFARSLEELLTAVRSAGSEVAVDELVDSDLILPPADSTVADVRGLLGDDGLIPG